MSGAKDMVLRPIGAQESNDLIRRVHYSGKPSVNAQLHIGAFLNGRLEGALQFGPSLDKRHTMGLVSGTGWNEFIELNRMAFTDTLPRNSESRAIAIAMKLLRKHASHIKWVVSYADGAQCGDGTIYRASSFVLTGIKPNTTLVRMPDGLVIADIVLQPGNKGAVKMKKRYGKTGSETARTFMKSIGALPIPGFQLRYMYFIDPSCRERLTVPILPFSEIERRGAGMYRGESRAGSVDSDTPAIHAGEDGAVPIPALHNDSTHTKAAD